MKRKSDGIILCRKEINYVRMSQKEREQLHAEFAILSSLRHPNIVGYYHREHLKSTQDLHLYMEYCGNGDLGRYIKKLQADNRYADEGFVWSMFAQLVTALYRCHYGIDPPDVGSNVMGLGNTAKPRVPAGGVMILHRDLKPENVFLGEDHSVKLGDFGLSKIMQSHDFASTYVGTPFYMSPEICAAERYTLKSDIWSLGCIIYELCTREPPFNAKSHFQLVQKIKEGRIAPIPSVYSSELFNVIKDCLKVNPDRRPDTATLLNLPVVKLMRKEKEVVELNRILKTKEELVIQRLCEAEEKLKKVTSDQAQMKQEIEASVRREWELKARLEIDRLVQLEIERLQKNFDAEVQARVDQELARRTSLPASNRDSLDHNDIPFCSVSTSGDGDFPSTTDLTELSIESPEPTKAVRKGTRTPFGRAQTMFVGTPMDVEMGEPSPISIASLSLSPRRNGGAQPHHPVRNIFAAAGGPRMQAHILSDSEDEEEPDLPSPPSPTRVKSTKNPFKPANGRPPLISQATAPVARLNTQHQPNIFAAANSKALSAPSIPTLTSQPDLRAIGASKPLHRSPSRELHRSPSRELHRSPSRRLSKIPSSANILADAHAAAIASPTRKPSMKRLNQAASNSADAGSGSADLNKLAIKNNMALKAASNVHNANANVAPKGRTLVELAQARAGGRSLDGSGAGHVTDEGSPKGKMRGAATWDPERDEMPSPFLVRARQPVGTLRRS